VGTISARIFDEDGFDGSWGGYWSSCLLSIVDDLAKLGGFCADGKKKVNLGHRRVCGPLLVCR